MNVLSAMQQVFTNCPNIKEFANYIQQNVDKRKFTEEQAAMFLAQCGHESQGFTRLEENLNYSAKSLYNVFRKYFPTMGIAEEYARRPEKIANLVYGSRMGNGSAETGDGWKYRGRGILQITGKYNYRQLEYDTKLPVVDNPDLLLEVKNAVESAFWYWDKNNLVNYSDIEIVTKKINGGLNGLDDRKKLYSEILGAL